MEHEKLLIEAFIISTKRKRFLELLSNPKKRHKILAELPHFSALNEKYSFKIPANLQTPEQILNLLRDKGAPEKCYLISVNSELDMKEKKLKNVLELVVGYCPGVLISCIPGKLGYYEGEDPGERYLLHKD